MVQAGPGAARAPFSHSSGRDAMSDTPTPHYPEIPYGWAWFKGIRQEGCLYVELFRYAGERGIPLYVLIDEYDNFTNTILAHEGAEAYHSFTHGGGFFRSFFATLKGGRVGQPQAPVHHWRP